MADKVNLKSASGSESGFVPVISVSLKILRGTPHVLLYINDINSNILLSQCIFCR